MEIHTLEPKAIWSNFAALNAVPRASKKEERIIEFMKQFGKNLGLTVETDEVQNVLIRKRASAGMENRKAIILQGHLDMVHQKNSDSAFDFENSGIDMYVDGDWVKARGTTLGADNGLGVAAIMGILASTDIAHPDIEALFTIDEETGMTGALGLKGGWLKGKILLNLDTEEDNEIDIGCAGGMDVTAEGKYSPVSVPHDFTGIRISVKGLQGGHSGMDIHKGFGNANKLMNRLIYSAKILGIKISSVDGGSLRNAIPRESNALLTINKSSVEECLRKMQECKNEIIEEYRSIEPSLSIEVTQVDAPQEMMVDTDRVVGAIYTAVNGVFRMSPDIEDLVEASNNVARVEIKNGTIKVLCLCRSSVESSKWDVAYSLRSAFELAGLDVKFSGDYPGWTPNINSPILQKMTGIYEDMFGQKPQVVACHAGLECGILGRNYPGMDMISFGPTIKGAHSPDERASISSSQKFWKYLVHVLSNIPEK